MVAPAIGAPIRRFASADGSTKFDRLGVVALLAVPVAAAGPGPGMAWRRIGADFPGLTPAVLRIDGLTACGLNAMDDVGGRFSGGWFSNAALRPVTNPSGAPGGKSCGNGAEYSSTGARFTAPEVLPFVCGRCTFCGTGRLVFSAALGPPFCLWATGAWAGG